MFTSCISPQAKNVYKKLAKKGISQPFYLAGGTALALQIGHRHSVDLDFFSEKKFSVKRIVRDLSDVDPVTITFEDTESISVELGGAKLSFLYYPYRLLFPFVLWNGYGKLADVRDIACMKIDAIASRGTKRDFVDLYYLLSRFSFGELLMFFGKKYENVNYNTLHIMKSMAYFADAEDEAMPKQTKPIPWQRIKKRILDEVRAYEYV